MHSRPASTLAMFGAITLIGVQSHAAHAQSYNVLDLGLPKGYTQAFPRAMNNPSVLANVAIVGRMTSTSGSHGFYWSKATGIVDLGPLSTDGACVNNNGEAVANGTRALYWRPGMAAPIDFGQVGGQDTHAYSINDSGVIVGSAFSSGGLYWLPNGSGGYGPAQSLPPMDGGGLAETGRWVNNSGDIGGTAMDANNVRHAVVWRNTGTPASPRYGTPVDLGALLSAANSHVQIMSERPAGGGLGRVAGDFTGADGISHWFVSTSAWDATLGDYVFTAPFVLADLGNSNVQAWGISPSGLSAGHALENTAAGPQMRAVAWDAAGNIRRLGSLGGSESRAYGTHFNGWGYTMNGAGTAVGYATIANGTAHAFVCKWGQTMQDLNSSALTPAKAGFSYLGHAACINDLGCITGSGITQKGSQEHVYLLTPK